MNRRVVTPNGPALPKPTHGAGRYMIPVSPSGGNTSAAVGIGTLRLTAWLNPFDITIDRLGGEVAVIGDAGSKVRLGIYYDNGAAYPGSLMLDAGQIAGDSATLQDLTVSLFIPAGLYWLGGTVQTVTTTQPTVRTISSASPVTIFGPTTLSGSNPSYSGYSMSGVTGAFPSTFSATVSAGSVTPRIHMRAV